MQWDNLIEGRLIKRYKRFLADVELLDGTEITAHCANTGKMTGCAEPGSRVWLSKSDNPKRKYPHSWQLVEVAKKQLACINTALANDLVEEAICHNRIQVLTGYDQLRREVRYGDNSRIDLLLESEGKPSVWVEVKSVTLMEQEGMGYFPDTVTARGAKHLIELTRQVATGDRAVLVFCVMHTGIRSVQPADHIDPEYGHLLREAVTAGVEVLAYSGELTVNGYQLESQLTVML